MIYGKIGTNGVDESSEVKRRILELLPISALLSSLKEYSGGGPPGVLDRNIVSTRNERSVTRWSVLNSYQVAHMSLNE